MWKHNKEAIAAIEEFNEKLEVTIGDDREFSSDHYMVLETDGNSAIIKFMGVVLWNSEDDEREFNEGTNEYEPLLEFLRKQAIKELERFSKVLLPPKT